MSTSALETWAKTGPALLAHVEVNGKPTETSRLDVSQIRMEGARWLLRRIEEAYAEPWDGRDVLAFARELCGEE